jgi:hypothetical protein
MRIYCTKEEYKVFQTEDLAELKAVLIKMGADPTFDVEQEQVDPQAVVDELNK